MRSSFSSRGTDNVGKGLVPFDRARIWGHISIVCVRIAFGGIWAWNTLQLARYLTTQASSVYVQQMVTSSQQAGQHISSWGNFWQQIATWQPVGFILICVVGMGLVACGLLFGLLTNLACGLGGMLALFFWSTQLVSLIPIGVQAGDTGVLLVFLLAFLGFMLSGAGQMFGADRILVGSMGGWAFLAGGRRDASKELPGELNEQAQWRKVDFPIATSKTRGIARRVQTRAMNEVRVSSVREKEVVGAHTRRFTAK